MVQTEIIIKGNYKTTTMQKIRELFEAEGKKVICLEETEMRLIRADELLEADVLIRTQTENKGE